MKKEHYLYLIVCAITVTISVIIGFSLAQRYYGDLEARVELIEQQFRDTLKPGQEVKMDELKVYVDKETTAFRNQYQVVMIFGLPLTLAAILATIFFAYQYAAELAKSKAEKAFRDPDVMLKENCKILVITPDVKNDLWLEKFFLLMEFPRPEFISTSEYDTIKDKQFDLAILNVPNDKERTLSSQNDFIEKITNSKSVFYFGPGSVNNELLSKDGRLSFANAKSQLYGNVINALKFQKMLK